MALDDFSEDKLKEGAKSSYTGGGGEGKIDPGSRWVTKIDWSKPYLVVARDDTGEIFYSKGSPKVIRDPDDPIRLDEHPTRQMEVLVRFQSKAGWLYFCNLSKEQLDKDPEEVYEEDPTKLLELDEKVYYPPGVEPNKDRVCRLCGAISTEEDVTIVELDLQEHRRVPVCASHTVEELAQEGLLQ